MNLLGNNVSLYRFANDKSLFGGLELDSSSWFGWNVLFKFYSKMKLNKKEAEFFERVTAMPYQHDMPVPNKWLLLIGRGGGKTRFISRVSPYRALTFDRPLHSGQRAQNVIFAPTLDGGLPAFDYAQAMIEENPMLYKTLVKERAHAWQGPIVKNRQEARMRFANGTTIELKPANRIPGRGKSIYTLILEEAAHFKLQGLFGDESIYKAAKPALMRFAPYSMAFLITTPYTKEGLVWSVYHKYYGKVNPSWFVVQGSCFDFNPIQIVEEEEKDDLDYYRREYLAQFVDALSCAFSAELIEDAVTVNCIRRPYVEGFEYFGFVDPASLSLSANTKFNDEYVAGVAHCERNKIVIDKKIWFSAEMNGRRYTPDDATAKAIELFKSYKVRDVEGDKFGSGYIEHKYVDAGFKFEACKIRKSDLYIQAVPMFTDNKVELLDDEITKAQFKALERKRGRDSKDRIDHARDKHDDRCNVDCGLISIGAKKLQMKPSSLSDIVVTQTRGADVGLENEVTWDYKDM